MQMLHMSSRASVAAKATKRAGTAVSFCLPDCASRFYRASRFSPPRRAAAAAAASLLPSPL